MNKVMSGYCMVCGRGRYLFVGLGMLVASFFVYANTFTNAWTYDDYAVIVDNPDILSIESFFFDSYPGRPLRELSYLLDYTFFGLKPFWWHVQNIFWHGLNAILLFLLVVRLGGSNFIAWFAGMLFIVHPLQVEVVANISHRKDSLALAFTLISLISFTGFFARSLFRWRFHLLAASLVAGILACMSKENAIVLPLIFLVYEWVFVSPERRLFLRRKYFPILFVSLSLLGARILPYLLDGHLRFTASAEALLAKWSYYGDASFGTYFTMVLKSWAFMFWRFFYPVNLAVEYQYALPTGWGDLWVLSTIAGILVLFAGMLFTFKKHPIIFFFLIWILLFYLPTSNLWPLAYFAADRYLYAPSVGVFVLVALLFRRVFFDQRFCLVSAGLALGLFIFLTFQQNRVWRSDELLHLHALAVSPQSAGILGELGKIYQEKGENALALDYYLRAEQEDPRRAPVQYNLGVLYENMGLLQKARKHYRKFLDMDLPPVYEDFAVALKKRHVLQYGMPLK